MQSHDFLDGRRDLGYLEHSAVRAAKLVSQVGGGVGRVFAEMNHDVCTAT